MGSVGGTVLVFFVGFFVGGVVGSSSVGSGFLFLPGLAAAAAGSEVEPSSVLAVFFDPAGLVFLVSTLCQISCSVVNMG